MSLVTTTTTNEDGAVENCSICLQSISDRTVLPTCSHQFCFECILIWSEQSRRCPLCTQPVGDYVIHHIRSKYDYARYYLPPLASTSSSSSTLPRGTQRQRSRRSERVWGVRRDREQEELERAIARRRWVYEHRLYAKHIASNPHTRYRPYPTPAQFAASPELIARMTAFLTRELRVWVHLDVEFFTTFTISIMKSLDIRSESAIKLLAEFLDTERGGYDFAEHLAHEIYSYLRSPYRDLAAYDSIVQYDAPTHSPPLSPPRRAERWRRAHSPSPSPSPPPSSSSGRMGRRSSPSPSRSPSWSPSGRRRSFNEEAETVGTQDEHSSGLRWREKGKGRAPRTPSPSRRRKGKKRRRSISSSLPRSQSHTPTRIRKEARMSPRSPLQSKGRSNSRSLSPARSHTPTRVTKKQEDEVRRREPPLDSHQKPAEEEGESTEGGQPPESSNPASQEAGGEKMLSFAPTTPPPHSSSTATSKSTNHNTNTISSHDLRAPRPQFLTAYIKSHLLAHPSSATPGRGQGTIATATRNAMRRRSPIRQKNREKLDLMDYIRDGNNGKQVDSEAEEKIMTTTRDDRTQATHTTSADVLRGMKQDVECTNVRGFDGDDEDRLKRLREKLENEKRLLAFSSPPSSPPRDLDREAKLRVQAHLRVRLAAAKRGLDAGDEQALTCKREDALGANLRNRRNR